MRKYILIIIGVACLAIAVITPEESTRTEREHQYIPLVPDDNWYQEDYFWFDPSEPWEIAQYGKVTNNKFDLISNTCYKILIERDTSEWAHQALDSCRKLLLERKRWPDRLNQDDDPKTRIGWRVRAFIWKTRRFFRGGDMEGIVSVYGHQRRMSRDPFIGFTSASAMLGKWEYIEEVKIPWYLYRPNTWRWKRRLIEDNRKDYLQRIDLIRALAITFNVE